MKLYQIRDGLRRRGLSLASRGLFGLALALGGAARAQVIDIGADGSSHTYSGPVLSSAQGIAPIGPSFPDRSASKASISQNIRDAAARHQISAQLVEAVAWQESRFHQTAASPKGARGVMQLMPATARDLGVDASDVSANIEGGAAYLAALLRRFDGDIVKTLAAYDAGPAAVQRFGGTPPFAETRAYVTAVLDRLARTAPAQAAYLEAP